MKETGGIDNGEVERQTHQRPDGAELDDYQYVYIG
jgi:hypothetical protein